MTINCVWEHNGNDTLLYAVDFVGAYTRGESLEIAKEKMPAGNRFLSATGWAWMPQAKQEIVIVEEKRSELTIRDADSDVLFESEQAQLTIEEYKTLKTLALKSAQGFPCIVRIYSRIRMQSRYTGAQDLLRTSPPHSK